MIVLGIETLYHLNTAYISYLVALAVFKMTCHIRDRLLKQMSCVILYANHGFDILTWLYIKTKHPPFY